MGVLEKVASTDFLQAIALLHSRRQREQASAAGVKETDLPPVRATKQSLLDLPITSYQDFRHPVERGFKTAAQFLRQLSIFRVADLPYQTQVLPLAAILTILGPKWENATVRAKLARWFWCGIFGELYGSATESRFAKDVQECRCGYTAVRNRAPCAKACSVPIGSAPCARDSQRPIRASTFC
jgi:hypothetical protein